MKNFLQVNRALAAEKNIYLNLNQLPSKNDGGQSCDGNRQSRLMSQSGCSAVDVPMTSYGAPDEHPMSIRSASDGTRWNSRGWKYVAMIFAVLVLSIVNIGMAWADTELANINFKSWTPQSISAGSTVNGCYFKSAVTISADKGATFGGNAATSSNWVSIPLSGINGSITITLTHASSRPQWKNYFKGLNAAPSSSDLSSSPSSMGDNTRPGSNTTTSSWTINTDKLYGVFYVGKGSNGLSDIYSIRITTPDWTYYYRGADNSWRADAMIKSSEGFYSYKSSSTNDHQFKIAKSTDGWDYNYSFVDAGYLGTSITTIGDYGKDNCYIWSAPASYYIIVFRPGSVMNTTANPKICASATLPAEKFTISFNNGGGSGSMSSISNVLYGSEKVTPANTFTKSGYRFTGWKANVDVKVGGATKTAGTLLDDEVTIQEIKSDITLTAQWEVDDGCNKIFAFAYSTDATNAGVTNSTSTFTGFSTGSNDCSGSITIDGKLYSVTKRGSNSTFSITFSVPANKVGTLFGLANSSGTSARTLTLSNGDGYSRTQSSSASKTSATAITYTDMPAGSYTLSADNGASVPLLCLKLCAAGECEATQPGTISKGTLSGCSLRLTAGGSPAANNTWYWQSSESGTDKTESGATKDVTAPGTYYIRSFCSTGSGCWSDARSVTVSASDLTPAAPTALAAASPTAKGVTLTVTDAANTNDYEFYVNTSSSAPSAGTSASYTSTGKSVTITDKYAGTTFYAWARAKCGSNKSAWTALGDGGTFTTSTVSATYNLTNVTNSSGAESGIGGSAFTAVFAAVTGYSLPTPSVTIDGNAASSGTDYTWTAGTGTISIPANKINGNIVITLNSAAAAPSSVAITGNWLYFAGETIELTATPTGGNGPVTYQWYKGGKADGNAIEGATSATYTKASCAFADAGSYYCKVTCGGSASTWGQNGDAYEVKVPHLYVKTGRNDGVKSDFGDVDFTRVDASTATASMTLGANWDYCYNIADGCGHYYGNAGTMQYNNYGPWTTNVNNQDCGLRTTNGATYVFTINYSNWTELKTTVTFPSSDQAADKIIYFDNQTVDWSTLHYRIGRADHTQATPMTKVPGTNNLYTVTTAAYSNAAGWHIANNAGWTGSNSIYRTYTNGDKYSITYATAHEGGAVTESAVTVTPTTSRGMGGDAGINNNCTFYNYEITTGMKTQNVAISDYSNGTITVNYVNTSNEAATLTSGNADLAHTVILTSITTSPNEGYDAGAITINGSAYSGANYVVTGATTIAASFTPQTYSITYKDQGGAAFSGSHAAGHPTTHTYGTATTLKTASKTGYTFGGWYGNSGCTGEAMTSIGATSITAGIILYAKWTPVATLYTVTFDSNGGSTTPDAIEQASEDASITMPAAPTYADHTFQGWVIGGTTKAAGASYTPTANVTAYASWKENCAGGGGSGATLFSQNFNSATAVAYEDRASSKLSITTSSGNNIVGNTAASQFTSITADKKGSTGIAINSASGGNSQSASGIFQAYYNNTGGYWSICKTSDFAATAPTAIKVGMKVWAKVGSSSSAVMANFAVGDGFSDGLTNASPGTSSVHSGFSITNESSMKFAAYNVYNTKIYNTTLTQSSWMALTWVINNTGSALTYDDPKSSETTVNNDCYDLWMGTTLVAHNIAATTAAKNLQNLYIGSPSGKNHEIRLDDISVVDLSPAGSGCYYVTYNGNGAEAGSISDATAHTSGSNVTVLGNTGGSAFTKTGYRFNGWNTSATGNGTSYAAGATISSISADVTLYAQWVADACSAPSEPTISGTSVRTVGQTITLNAACATGADASTTYTWYKGDTWGEASVTTPVQTAMTAGEGGRIFDKASCVAGDAGTYWCEASNGTGCEAHNATGFTVTVSAAVATHIYYYKDADHYSGGTYSNPEGNEAVKKDNQSLSSPWTICNACMTGVDSVVAHGATYDGKNNHMNAYIKLPTGGDATTKNIKFALTAGYTGTLTIKIGGYENNPTVTLQPLNTSTGVLGDAITPTSGTVGGVATTEDNFNAIEWPLAAAGGTYVLTVTTKTGYISQIDMTTETSARFNVTYNGNGNTGGTVPTDATNYSANASVTVAANTGDGKLVKENYTGAGWNTANNGTGTNYVPGSGTFTITANTTLYAHWTQTINLAPGAHGTGSLGATVSWNGTAVRGFTAHTAAGYSLTGYYTETSGGTKVLNADGSFAATNVTDYITDGKWSRTGAAATLYAQWSGSAIVTNTLGVGSSSKWSSAISTTAPLQITDLSALAAVGGLTIEDANGTSADGRALTCKVGASGATTKTDDKYLQLSFSIAAGYKLRVTGLDVTVRSVSKAGKYHLELVGTTGSLIPDDEQVASGAVNTIFDDAYNVELTGDVTLKLWAYGKDGSNLMEYYRLGSPIAIYGAVEETCTPPTFSGLDYSATEYTQGATASAISVTGAENEDSYQWYYNTVNDRSDATKTVEAGATSASFTPSTTAAFGTRYYWCELKNTCTTVKTPTVAVTVSASASNPTVTWSDVKLNGAATTVNYGGGKYELRATVNETGWSGTLESSMVTAPAGIYIHNIGTGTEDSKQYIEFQFDVTTAFDREANETIGFHLSLPAISGTPNWNALTSDKQVSYTACDVGEGEGGMIYLPLTETQTTAASGMKYYWETAGSGRLASQYGGSAMGSTLAAEPYHTADHDFPRYAASTGDKWMFQTYVGGVNKVRVVFRAGGALKSSNLTISKFCYDTEYFSSQGDRQVSIGEVSPSKASFASGEDGYMEFTVPEMAANSYAYFQTGSSNIKIYGIVLYSESSGSGGSVETDPTWTGGLNKDGSSVVERAQGAANFTYTISTTTNTLGGITYSSSNSSVAEVNAKTGEVRITATGESTQTAVITATLARSGCYQPATRTYTVRVTGNACTDPIGTIAAEDLGCSGTRLTFSGYADGANIKWYRNGTEIPSATSAVYTTTDAGSYYAVAHLNCDRQSNTIVVTAAEVDADRVVEKWYIKNGRLTPDIKLWTLDEGSHLVSVAWSPSNATGLDQEGDIYESESDGAVYLTGRAPSSNDTGEDKSYTLTLTINNGCAGETILSDASKQITIIHQKNTDKHVLAFVVGNTEMKDKKYVAIGKGFTESIPASQTTNVSLYNEIAKNFDVQATNIYSTDDEQKIKEYYSQFDIICITDYPNTKTKGSHSVSFSDAIGVMVDIRPVLTMEAWVSGLSNWNKKGISGDPKSPTTRQYTMLLQCKDHEIFTGTTLTKVGEGEDAMYRVTMVDKNKEEYKTLDANYGDGEHKANEGYQYGKKPALQGFTFSQAMADADLLPLGLIDDGAGNDLQVGLERQREMSARMMVLGINSTAMERLTADGERVVINALNYLMKKNAEDIADCSTSFVGGAEGDGENWMNADNWTGNTVPDKTQKVRILAPCVVPEGEKVHVAGVLIAPNDGGTYNGGSTPTTGSLTIAAGGALVVDGKIQAVTAPAYNRPRATSAGDLAVLANSDGNGTLIFDNGEGETKATIQMYSKAIADVANNYAGLTWQYVAVPYSDNNNAHHNYYNSWLYAWAADNSGWVVVPNGGNVYPWIGYCITQDAATTYTMDGTLVETSQQEFTVPAGVPAAPVEKVIGNSWTAPLQVKQFTDEDFGSLTKNIYLFNTGYDPNGGGEFDKDDGRYEAGTYVTIPIHSSPYSGDSLVSSLQAFFVKNESGSEATLTLDYDRHVRPSRSTDIVNAGPMHAPSRFIASDEPTVLKIWASGSRYDDRLILLEREDFSTGYDAGWDGDKWKEGDASPRIYTIMESGEEAITATPELEGTIIGFRAGEDNSYTLRFEYNESNDPLYILDTENRIYTRVLTDQTYQFTTNDKAAHSRFVLTRTDGQMTPTGIDDVQGDKVHEAKAKKFIMDDKMYILFNGHVFDATGKAVK